MKVEKTVYQLVLATISLAGSATLADKYSPGVIVTAQNRAELLQDTPIPQTEFGGNTIGDTIKETGYSDLNRLSVATPNVTISQQKISDRLSIGGISSSSNGDQDRVGRRDSFF